MSNITIKSDIKRYEKESEDIRTRNNIRICRQFAILFLLGNAWLIMGDLTIYKPLRNTNVCYLYSHYLHISAFIWTIIWLIISGFNKHINIKRGKVLYYSFTVVALYWGAILGLNNIFISGQSTIFVICFFGTSAVLYLSPREALITYLSPAIIFVVGLYILVGDRNILISHIVNILTTGIVALIASRLRFNSFIKDFKSNKDLVTSKTEIEEAYRRLEETNIKLKNEIKERQLAEEKISHLIYNDPLTGIYNRNKILEEVNHLLKDKSVSFAVLFIDLDEFKGINDKYGHEAGDKVLRVAAMRLKGIIGPGDTISRFGGDEFVVILRGLKDNLYVNRVAAAIIQEMTDYFTLNDKKLMIGASIGISLFPEHGDDAATLIYKADSAMYQVKKNGGCNYLLYDGKSEIYS